jgi:hypothetical protein
MLRGQCGGRILKFVSALCLTVLPAFGDELLVVSYPVADIVVLPASMPEQKVDHQPLLEHLQRTIAAKSWKGHGGDGSATFHPQTYSLVVRQSKAVHKQLADELSALRRRIDAQVVIEMRVISATREDLDRFLPRLREGLGALRGDSVDALFGATGRVLDEQELRCVLDLVAGNPRCTTVASPKITMFREQVATVATEPWHFVVAAKLAADGQSITLRIADHGDDSAKAVARTQTLDVPNGTTRLLRFTAESAFPGVIPTAPDVKEQLVFVTARLIDAADEAVTLGVPVNDTSRVGSVSERRLKFHLKR